MKSESIDKIVFLMLIAGREQKDDLLSALSDAGVLLTSTIYGRGTVEASYLKNILGFVPEEHKAVISCVLTCEKSNKVLKMLDEEFKFGSPNTGVAFTIPVERVSF